MARSCSSLGSAFLTILMSGSSSSELSSLAAGGRYDDGWRGGGGRRREEGFTLWFALFFFHHSRRGSRWSPGGVTWLASEGQLTHLCWPSCCCCCCRPSWFWRPVCRKSFSSSWAADEKFTSMSPLGCGCGSSSPICWPTHLLLLLIFLIAVGLRLVRTDLLLGSLPEGSLLGWSSLPLLLVAADWGLRGRQAQQTDGQTGMWINVAERQTVR